MSDSVKRARPDHPIHDLIRDRWSPYAFSDKAVAHDDLLALFEAARWAASSYNEQPWSYLVATKDQPEEHARILSCLVEGNRTWAKNAPVLALGLTRLTFNRNGKPNAAAVHDLGLAAASLTFEATSRGLYVHQMIGILPEKAKELFAVPDDVEVKTGIAVGHLADASTLPESLKERDTSERPRKPLKEFVWQGKWGEAAPFVS